MDINWLREELKKEKNNINWVEVINTSNKIYKEINETTSILGLSKGFLNLVKVNSSYGFDSLVNDINVIYPDAKVYKLNTQSKLIQLIKGDKSKNKPSDINMEEVKNNRVVVITDKTTLETALNRYKLPYIKFLCSRKTIKENNKYLHQYLWRREGDKRITWKEGDSLSFKRDNILNELFED